MSENNNELERNYEVAERKEGGPIIVNSFSNIAMINGVPTLPEQIPEVLKDPRTEEDFLTKMLHAFSEVIDGIWKKK